MKVLDRMVADFDSTINDADEVVKNIRIENFNQFKEKVDIIVGGPPCPPYSKSRFYIKEKKRALEDEDSYTLVYFCKASKLFSALAESSVLPLLVILYLLLFNHIAFFNGYK